MPDTTAASLYLYVHGTRWTYFTTIQHGGARLPQFFAWPCIISYWYQVTCGGHPFLPCGLHAHAHAATALHTHTRRTHCARTSYRAHRATPRPTYTHAPCLRYRCTLPPRYRRTTLAAAPPATPHTHHAHALPRRTRLLRCCAAHRTPATRHHRCLHTCHALHCRAPALTAARLPAPACSHALMPTPLHHAHGTVLHVSQQNVLYLPLPPASLDMLTICLSLSFSVCLLYHCAWAISHGIKQTPLARSTTTARCGQTDTVTALHLAAHVLQDLPLYKQRTHHHGVIMSCTKPAFLCSFWWRGVDLQHIGRTRLNSVTCVLIYRDIALPNDVCRARVTRMTATSQIFTIIFATTPHAI